MRHDTSKRDAKQDLPRAVRKLVEEEVKVNPKDPFLVRKPMGKSGLRDFSKKHDEYLYGKKRRRGAS